MTNSNMAAEDYPYHPSGRFRTYLKPNKPQILVDEQQVMSECQ
jgi:hypothetical protein